eukprot:1808240-Prorocentrum_lima.AAC.1
MVTGPQCPPLSSSGSRRTWEDARSRPMDQVLRVVAAQAQGGRFMFAVLENVAKFNARQKAAG